MRTLVSMRALAGLAVALMGAAILGAWAFELLGGFKPCPLCLEQRLGYYIAIPAALCALLLAGPSAGGARIALVLAAVAIGWSASLGGYQAGAEWGYWPGPDTCSGAGEVTDASDLMAAINAAHVVSCTEVQGRVLSLSFAGWNALAAGLSALLLLAAACASSMSRAERLAQERGAELRRRLR